MWENLRNNNLTLPLLSLPGGQTNFLAPVATELQSFKGQAQTLNANFPDLTMVDPGLRNGYTHSYFAGIQERITDHLTAEVNGLGSYGRRLITTDIVNRDFSTLTGRYNPRLPDIAYRAAQGYSDYNALTALVRYQAKRGIVQAGYTWSHTEDNQSDPLLGDFFNLNFTSINGTTPSSGRAAFSQQFNPHADWGNSDFDQRHNLVVSSYWNLPSVSGNVPLNLLTRGWGVSGLAAFRSGFPYTVTGTSTAIAGQGIILNNRPTIVNPAQTVLPSPVPVTGGEQLLTTAGFAEAAASTLGNAGRNAFRGPGFYNLDVSVQRAFGLRWLGESGRLAFRASAFNLLNHANLGNPDSLLTSPTFGLALYGRLGSPKRLPRSQPAKRNPPPSPTQRKNRVLGLRCLWGGAMRCQGNLRQRSEPRPTGVGHGPGFFIPEQLAAPPQIKYSDLREHFGRGSRSAIVRDPLRITRRPGRHHHNRRKRSQFHQQRPGRD